MGVHVGGTMRRSFWYSERVQILHETRQHFLKLHTALNVRAVIHAARAYEFQFGVVQNQYLEDNHPYWSSKSIAEPIRIPRELSFIKLMAYSNINKNCYGEGESY
jgi:hypothetical protein